MTTIIDPAGTPIPVYNRSGTTIIELVCPATTPQTVVSITSVSQTTVIFAEAVIDPMEQPPAVELPTGAQIGDVVEIFVKNTTGGSEQVIVLPPAGQTLSDAQVGVAKNFGKYFRKLTSTAWGAL